MLMKLLICLQMGFEIENQTISNSLVISHATGDELSLLLVAQFGLK